MIIYRQLCHFFRADMTLGMAVAKRFNINPDTVMAEMTTQWLHDVPNKITEKPKAVSLIETVFFPP